MAQRLRQLQGFPLAVCLFRFGPCAAGAGGWRAGCSVRPTASSAKWRSRGDAINMRRKPHMAKDRGFRLR